MAVLWDALQGTALFGVGLRGRGAAHQDQGWAMDCSKCATVAQRWDFRVGGCGGSTARGTGNIYVAVAGSVLLEGLKTINAGLAHLGWRGGAETTETPKKISAIGFYSLINSVTYVDSCNAYCGMESI